MRRIAIASIALSGCAGRTATERTTEAHVPTPRAAPSSTLPAIVAASPATATHHPTLLITNPQVLAALERQGLALGSLLGVAGGRLGNHELGLLPRFAPLVQELEREVRAAGAADKLAGVDVARFSHRLFDTRFLRLAAAHFQLAAVVNRPDRAAFAASSCGETRLIYRLGYALDAERSSKLPMTLGVELQVPRGKDGCREAARRWLEPGAAHSSTDSERRATWLSSEHGPLAPALRAVSTATARVVVNLQLVRWPATMRPDLGGHAEYLLRSFRPDAHGVLRPERLENTIDPSAFARPVPRRALLTFLEQNAAGVDAGTPLLPDALLATRALSVTPRGLSRLANRPFSATLGRESFAERDFSRGAFVKSVDGLLRRLDELSCPGCHQARSVAGFHVLGEDAADAPLENALAIAVSPHVTADLPRRLRIAEQMLAGAEPDFSAPFAERSAGDGGYGQACALGEDPTFAGWTCSAGLTCSSIGANPGAPIGQCLPPEHQVGDACENGGVTEQRDARRDRMRGVELEPCPNMLCNRSAVGFPGGMCTAACGSPGASCGAIAILDPFNACLGRGASFLTCIRGNVQPAGLRVCDAQNPCRDDYVCARAARGGVCLPPYFVFQLRVDGHSSSLR